MVRMLNELQACLLKIVIYSSGLLDFGVIFGTSFEAFRRRAMHYIDSLGIESLFNKVRNMHRKLLQML